MYRILGRPVVLFSFPRERSSGLCSRISQCLSVPPCFMKARLLNLARISPVWILFDTCYLLAQRHSFQCAHWKKTRPSLQSNRNSTLKGGPLCRRSPGACALTTATARVNFARACDVEYLSKQRASIAFTIASTAGVDEMGASFVAVAANRLRSIAATTGRVARGSKASA